MRAFRIWVLLLVFSSPGYASDFKGLGQGWGELIMVTLVVLVCLGVVSLTTTCAITARVLRSQQRRAPWWGWVLAVLTGICTGLSGIGLALSSANFAVVCLVVVVCAGLPSAAILGLSSFFVKRTAS